MPLDVVALVSKDSPFDAINALQISLRDREVHKKKNKCFAYICRSRGVSK